MAVQMKQATAAVQLMQNGRAYTGPTGGTDNQGVTWGVKQNGNAVQMYRTDTGAAYKPDLNTEGKMGFNLGKAIKKVGNTVVQGAAGFAAGGGIGGTTGLVKGVIDNSKTSSPKATNLRTVGQAAVWGGAVNVAAGAAAVGVKALAAGGASSGGGVLSKAVAFGKSGGITGNFGNIAKAGLNAVKGAAPIIQGALQAFKKSGTPGTDESAAGASSDQQSLGRRVTNGYRNLKEGITRGRDLATDIQENGVGSNTLESVKEFFSPAPNTGAQLIASPGIQSDNTPLLLAGLGLAALLFIKKK